METIRELQAYGYAFASVVFAIILYWYMYHLYTSKKKGGKDYEKYSNMALNDRIDDSPVEKKEPLKEDKEEQ
jgi:cytochrome c oxidase cbb3-type subunit 4